MNFRERKNKFLPGEFSSNDRNTLSFWILANLKAACLSTTLLHKQAELNKQKWTVKTFLPLTRKLFTSLSLLYKLRQTTQFVSTTPVLQLA